MKSNRRMIPARVFAVLTLTLTIVTASAYAQSQAAESRGPETYQTLYFASSTQDHDARDILTDLRNMLPKARLYYVQSKNAISIHGTPEEIQLAQKILSDIESTKHLYRLTYTITQTGSGKPTETRHYAFTVAAGSRSTFKQGVRVPVVTGAAADNASAPSSQVQYLDVGLNIQSTLDSYKDGLQLYTKFEQSGVAPERSGIGTQDPIVSQTLIQSTTGLQPGKPLVLGSLDIPGSTQHQQVSVVAEPVQ